MSRFVKGDEDKKYQDTFLAENNYIEKTIMTTIYLVYIYIKKSSVKKGFLSN